MFFQRRFALDCGPDNLLAVNRLLRVEEVVSHFVLTDCRVYPSRTIFFILDIRIF
tara:strand:+ start:6477 stop:6641 length:165 start_codon:yes stop_codon:yes gene_type:complete